MLTLYNAGASVCSVKVRIGMAEKRLDWTDVLLTLPKGEQHAPEYLKLNPNGVVPTLVDDDLVISESSVILEYVDGLNPANPLMPTDKAAEVTTRIWLLRCLDIHSAINTMTFSTANRDALLATKTPEEITASIAKMPNPKSAAKRRDLLDNGTASDYLVADFFTLRQMFDDMQNALSKTKWLTGDTYALADVALLAYIDRLERLGLAGFWETRTPAVGAWLNAGKARPSYTQAFDKYVTSEEAAKVKAAGSTHWPAIKTRWDKFLADNP